MAQQGAKTLVDWQAEELEVEWSDELLLAVIADAALNPRTNQNEGLAANLSYLLMRMGLQHNDAHYKNRIGNANGSISTLDSRINEQFWRLVLRGVLVPSSGRFEVTVAGRSSLSDIESDARIALVGDGLRGALEQRSPGIDQVALRYAELAQDCFFSGHFEGSVILLGAASELVLGDLIEAVNEKASVLGISEVDPGSTRAQLEDLRDLVTGNRKLLKAAIVKAGGEGNWLSDLPGLLDGANAIRLTRNDAGHPSRDLPRRYEAHGALVMFPHLAEALVTTAEELRLL